MEDLKTSTALGLGSICGWLMGVGCALANRSAWTLFLIALGATLCDGHGQAVEGDIDEPAVTSLYRLYDASRDPAKVRDQWLAVGSWMTAEAVVAVLPLAATVAA